jgi:hypothetical protein
MKFLGAMFCLGNAYGAALHRLNTRSVLGREPQTTGWIVGMRTAEVLRAAGVSEKLLATKAREEAWRCAFLFYTQILSP